MRAIKLGLISVSALWLVACGGGEADYGYYDEPQYINWSGSANGTIVVDATDDAFEFELDGGYLHFGSTTYFNAWVDDFANFWVDGRVIGGVYYVRAIDGHTITALVSNSGYYLDFYGPESNLSWAETGDVPIYALTSLTGVRSQPATSNDTRQAQAATSSTGQGITGGSDSVAGQPPKAQPNAYMEEPTGSEPQQQGTLNKGTPEAAAQTTLPGQH